MTTSKGNDRVAGSSVILDETADIIRDRYGAGLDEITVERLAVGIFFTAVKISHGGCGISYTPAIEIHRDTARPALQKRPEVRFKGAPVKEILASTNHTTLFETVRLAVMNALSAPLNRHGGYHMVEGTDVFDLINLDKVKRIAMVGAIPPFIDRLKTLPGIELRVVDKNSSALRGDARTFCVPLKQTRRILSECDTVIITGAAIANGTIDSLLSWKSSDALAVVVGPTASIVPDVLFSRGVAIASGVIVSDTDLVLEMVAEGVLAYHLFDKYLKKLNIINPDLHGNDLLRLEHPGSNWRG